MLNAHIKQIAIFPFFVIRTPSTDTYALSWTPFSGEDSGVGLLQLMGKVVL